MIRAASKNHDSVAVVVDAADYAALIAELDTQAGATTLKLRRRLAADAYARTGAYDAAISRWFAGANGETWPRRLVIAGERREVLRYGENPHQQAAFYASGDARPGVASARQLQGKELSYNNYNDTDAAFEAVAEFADTACVIVKHANPCGVAMGASLREAYLKALACDPVSAFGGIIALNRPLDAATATEIAKLFVEVIVAPAVDDAALAIIAAKKNLRLLATGGMPDPSSRALLVKSLAGGHLVQDRDAGRVTAADLKIVTKRAPSAQEIRDLLFAFSVAKHVKSNAIVYAKDGATVGIGAGQMSRIDSSRIAAWKATEGAKAAGESQSRAIGSVVASDAFFPFADGLLAAAEAGVTAVIQPGGSIRDADVIAAADERNLAMVFTGMRHFRHDENLPRFAPRGNQICAPAFRGRSVQRCEEELLALGAAQATGAGAGVDLAIEIAGQARGEVPRIEADVVLDDDQRRARHRRVDRILERGVDRLVIEQVGRLGDETLEGLDPEIDVLDDRVDRLGGMEVPQRVVERGTANPASCCASGDSLCSAATPRQMSSGATVKESSCTPRRPKLAGRATGLVRRVDLNMSGIFDEHR
jgi:phosphoribosylaminoimidazolecarboxamide formyltransferase / IMP cyclohydrolase